MVRQSAKIVAGLFGMMALALALVQSAAWAASGSGSGNGAKVEGVITAVIPSNGLVTIKQTNGQSVNVTAVATTKIERNSVHATLDSFKIGDKGQALYNPATGIATKIQAKGL